MAKSNGQPDLDVEFQVSRIAEHGSVYSQLYRNLGIILGRNLLYTTFTLCFTLFAVNTFYYGGGMYAFMQVLPEVNLQTSPGLNLLIGALFEIPGYLLAIWLSACMSRKMTIVFGYVGIIICSASFLWMSTLVKTKFAVAGEF